MLICFTLALELFSVVNFAKTIKRIFSKQIFQWLRSCHIFCFNFDYDIGKNKDFFS